MEGILDQLTEAQRTAVTHGDGPLLILAGPGSGKTRVITHRIAWLLSQGIPDAEILALTFTNKAAEEMRVRVERLAPGRKVWISTFHRFCARLLRKYGQFVGLRQNYTIYDQTDSLRLLREAVLQTVDRSPWTAEVLAEHISIAKNNLLSSDQIAEAASQAFQANIPGEIISKVYQTYQQMLIQANAADFDDLLLHVANLLRDNPELRRQLDSRYRYIMVDEYQDTNLAQYAIVRAMSVDYPNLAVTGDPDQSIYGWRGANLNNILEFERDFPNVRVVRLERNYRSTKSILHVAATLIAHNVRRKEKGLYTENGSGCPVRLVCYPTHVDEARDIAAQIAQQIRSGQRTARDFAIFYRINALSRWFELALREVGVPYQLVHGVEFFQRKEIKDVLAYLHLLENPHDQVAFLRVINTPPRGIGRTTVERLVVHARQHRLSLLEAARDAHRIPSLNRRAAASLRDFAAMIDRLALAAGGPLEQLVGLVLSESGYRDHLRNQANESLGNEEQQDRLANVEELLTVAREFDQRHQGAGSLEGFLEQTSLVNDTDGWEPSAERVSLMTLHASKGLEFPVVFLPAVEEGLLPHERSRHDPDRLEEERRLMFVGITRCQQQLQISWANYREYRGQRRPTIPSSFLVELPRAGMEVIIPQDSPAETGVGTIAAAEGLEVLDYDERPAAQSSDLSDQQADKLSGRQTSELFGQQTSDLLGQQGRDLFDQKSDDLVDQKADHLLGPQGNNLSGQHTALWTDEQSHRTGQRAEHGDSRQPSVRLMTGADLVGNPPADVETFHQGMLVCHPQFGLGKIVALSGSGQKRQATVDFAAGIGRRKLRLADGQLRPIRVLQQN